MRECAVGAALGAGRCAAPAHPLQAWCLLAQSRSCCSAPHTSRQLSSQPGPRLLPSPSKASSPPASPPFHALQQSFEGVVRNASGSFAWRPERPAAPDFVAQKWAWSGYAPGAPAACPRAGRVLRPWARAAPKHEPHAPLPSHLGRQLLAAQPNPSLVRFPTVPLITCPLGLCANRRRLGGNGAGHAGPRAARRPAPRRQLARVADQPAQLRGGCCAALRCAVCAACCCAGMLHRRTAGVFAVARSWRTCLLSQLRSLCLPPLALPHRAAHGRGRPGLRVGLRLQAQPH